MTGETMDDTIQRIHDRARDIEQRQRQRDARQRYALTALPEVIRIMDTQLPKDFDPKQAAALIATTVFDIADACVREATKRG